jgi:hypothetical protein
MTLSDSYRMPPRVGVTPVTICRFSERLSKVEANLLAELGHEKWTPTGPKNNRTIGPVPAHRQCIPLS